MILVDTSVWIDHLRVGVPELAELLDHGEVLMHPFVVGEIACGNLANRRDMLRFLGALPMAPTARDEEVRLFVEGRRLMGRGLGYLDVHLLASAVLICPARFWTRDRRLAKAAVEFGIAFPLG